jgi:hypothetical protein
MALIRVKLSTNFPEWPLLRQTPGRKGVWGNCRFFLNEAVEECDYWVVYDDVLRPETTRCPPGNTLLITGEPPSVKTYPPRYAAQFARVLTCQRALRHRGAIYRQQAMPWMVGGRYLAEAARWDESYTKDYDELAALPPVAKTRLLSVISSDKAQTVGHRQRLEFTHRLKRHFGDAIDVFGRGLRDFEDKWDALAPYKYHVVLENGQFPDYWTEKLSDALLAEAYPFYSGCPNIGDYFSDAVLTRLDISDAEGAIRDIERGLAARRFEATVTQRREAAKKVLDEYNLFPTVEKIIGGVRQPLLARQVHVRPQFDFPRTLPVKIKSRVRRLITNITHRPSDEKKA